MTYVSNEVLVTGEPYTPVCPVSTLRRSSGSSHRRS